MVQFCWGEICYKKIHLLQQLMALNVPLDPSEPVCSTSDEASVKLDPSVRSACSARCLRPCRDVGFETTFSLSDVDPSFPNDIYHVARDGSTAGALKEYLEVKKTLSWETFGLSLYFDFSPKYEIHLINCN